MPLILDWLESHAQAGWKRPPALDAGTAARMREKGVPELVVKRIETVSAPLQKVSSAA